MSVMTIKFSQRELDLIKLVPFNKPINSTMLVELYFGQNPPLNARPIIISRLRHIAKKAEAANLDWRLHKTYRTGPIPQSFWREKVNEYIHTPL